MVLCVGCIQTPLDDSDSRLEYAPEKSGAVGELFVEK